MISLPTTSLQGALQSEESISRLNLVEESSSFISSTTEFTSGEEQLIIEVEGSSFETNNSSHGVQSTGLMAVRGLLDC
jgi:hypothetical protein